MGESVYDLYLAQLPFNAQPPVISLAQNVTAYEADFIKFKVSARDPESEIMTLKPKSALPTGAEFNITVCEPGFIEGELLWPVSFNQSAQAPYKIAFTAFDGSETSTANASITIKNKPHTSSTKNIYAAGKLIARLEYDTKTG
ncbi:hypothetical protein LDC_1384, partial [sediment metagenome]